MAHILCDVGGVSSAERVANARALRQIARMATRERIVINPDVCGGRPIAAGTRVRVADILDMLAGGTSEVEILVDFPFLTAADIRASMSYPKLDTTAD